ncbi:MAG: hypothetical protein AB7D29_10585 [Campylobacterales bacterium]
MGDALLSIGFLLILFGLLQNFKMQWASPNFLDWSSWLTIRYWKWGVHWSDFDKEIVEKKYYLTESWMKLFSSLNSFLYLLYVASMTLGIGLMFLGILINITVGVLNGN